MGCLHTRNCPIFPLLNASLSAWRDHYCDSPYGWRECARYRLSRSGELVPITLLPNGADALHLRGIPPVGEFGAGLPRQVTPSRFEPPPPSAPVPHHPQTPSIRPAPGRRRWWTRLADWISSPA